MPKRSTLTNLALNTNFLNESWNSKPQVDAIYTDMSLIKQIKKKTKKKKKNREKLKNAIYSIHINEITSN